MILQIRWLGVSGTTGIWLRNFSKLASAKGRTFLIVHILTNGNMNLAYFDFKQIHR